MSLFTYMSNLHRVYARASLKVT